MCVRISVQVRLPVGIAPSTTYASAAAGILAITFFAFDHYNNTYPGIVIPEPGLLAAATFLQTIDISRALLLQTPSCGPYVLMLFSMFDDLFIWLLLLGAHSNTFYDPRIPAMTPVTFSYLP